MTATKLISIASASAALLYFVASNASPAAEPAPVASPAGTAHRQARSSSASSGVVDEVSRLRGEVFQLRARTADIEEAEGRNRAPASPEDRAEAQARWVARAHEVLGEHFTADSTDPAWAQETESEFQEFFAGEVPGGVALEALECRGEVCRLELTCDGPDAIAEFTRTVMSAPPWNRTLQMLPGDDDRSGVVYVARSGHDLPEIEL